MATVTILSQVYTLPVLMTEPVTALWMQIQERYQVIQEGWRPQPRLLGVIPRPGVKLNDEDRFAELTQLIQDYQTIIHGLRDRQEEYGAFFAQLVTGVYQTVLSKSDTISHLEEERLTLHEAALAQRDATLEQWLLHSAEQLLRSIRLLGQATLLLVRHLLACRQVLEQLRQTSKHQQQELARVARQLGTQYRAYTLQKRIDRVARLKGDTELASGHFEQHLREQLAPLQQSILHSLSIGEHLQHLVNEINTILQQMHQHGATSFGAASESDLRLVAFLTTFALDRRRLGALLERLERHLEPALPFDLPPATAASPSVLIALDNMHHLIELRLVPLVKTVLRQQTVPALPAAAPEPRLRVLPPPPGIQMRPTLTRCGITFVWIPAGEFLMGAAQGDRDEHPPHRLRISQPFYLSLYPVTQQQWSTVMGENPSYFPGDDCPVEQVSWEDVQLFIRRLNAQEGRNLYRLPTEAEWEYAARAGATTQYCFGDDPALLGDHAWYADNARARTHPVGQLLPNAWGLHDMHGNVWEWVHDWYGPYTQHSAIDPNGIPHGTHRIIRGGSWVTDAWNCRVAYRDYVAPSNHGSDLGFRLLRLAQE